MTEQDADIIVIGSGHNALTAAAYLAEAGLEVLVLEAKPIIGGNTVTEELTVPGWGHDSCSSVHALAQSNPLLADDELGLISRYGLRYEYADPAAVLPLADGDAFVLRRSVEATADEIARFSALDAKRFVEMMSEWEAGLRLADRRWNEGLPQLDDDAGQQYAALRERSAWDVVHENFAHPVTRRLLLWMGFANFQPPTRPGTGTLPISMTYGRVTFGWATPIGGSGSLPRALVAHIEDHGGQVITDARVNRITIRAGRAVGVVTDDGRSFGARRGVVSSAHIVSTPELLGPDTPSEISDAAHAWRPGLSLFAVHVALRTDIRYRTGEGIVAAAAGGLGSPAGTSRQVTNVSNGIAERDDPWLLMMSQTVVDHGRAAGGTFKLLTTAPASLRSGRSWDEAGPEYAERLLDLVRPHVAGLDTPNVLAVVPETPAGLARRNINNLAGSCHGGEFELASGRHIPGWPVHTTSLAGLVLTGSTSHPGGSVSGWPGRNAARALLTSIGIDATAVMS